MKMEILTNFKPSISQCLPHTWLFCVELQLIVLSVPLLILLKKTYLSSEDSNIIRLSAAEEEFKKQAGPKEVCLIRLAFVQLIKSKAGLLSLVFLLAGTVLNFFTVYKYQLPPSWFYTFPDVAQKNYYFGIHLTKTWTHASVFLIGLLAGQLYRTILQLRNIQLIKARQPLRDLQVSHPQPSPSSTNSTSGQSDQMTLPQSHSSTSTIMAMEMGSDQTDNGSTSGTQSTSGRSKSGQNPRNLSKSIADISFQMVALICMSAIIFSTYKWSTQEPPTALVAALYDASSRLIWSLALVVLILKICLPNKETNRYTSMARILSHPACVFLGRLSFLAYLIAPYINTFILAVQEQSLFPSLFMIFHLIVGNIVITYIIAFILAIVIEQPVRRLICRLTSNKRSNEQEGSISVFRPKKQTIN